MSEVLLVEKREGIATLTLNRPNAMNALSRELRRALTEALADASRDADVGAVILTGAGRAFCAGLDLKELGGETGDSGSIGDAIGGGLDVVGAMEGCPKPILGAINGVAVTGGFEIALACDLLVASSEARFADTHARVGILPGWGLSVKLPRLVGIYRAKELSLTGNYLSAEQAERWGLVNRVVAPEELLPTCRSLAADMVSAHPESMRAYKRLIDRGYGVPFAEALRLEQDANREHARTFRPEDLAARRKAIQERGRTQSR